MEFSEQEIELARQLKSAGLPWEPEVGHYVFDTEGVVKPGSPFQDRVYFLLNYDCFMDRVGGVERFKEIMTWLPTWFDARKLLRRAGVSDAEVRDYLVGHQAFEQGDERLRLYELIQQNLHSLARHATQPAADAS